MTVIPKKLVELFVEPHKAEPTRRLSLLLGSGFSRPDGMPLVGHINERLSGLKEGDFYLYQEMSAGFYNGKYRDPNANITLNDRRIAEEFVAFYVKTFLHGDQSCFNYEKFFDYFSEFLVEKLHREEIEWFCATYNEKYGIEGQFNNGLNYLSRFLNIFNQLVASLLTQPKYYQNISYTGGYPGYEHFTRLIKELLKTYRVHVHSLNHDMLFDHIGSSVSGIFEHYSDGFAEAGSKYFGELRYRPKQIEEEFYKTYHVRLQYYVGDYSKRLSFLKLHGSVDYFPLYLRETDKPVTIKRDYGVGEVLMERFDEHAQKFVYENPFTHRYPAFLTGTTQKIKRYNDAFYENLFVNFKDNLENSEKLIVIGYGFQDDGINELLKEHFLAKGKKILVVDIKKPDCPLFKSFPEYFLFSSAGVSDTIYAEYEEFLRK